NTLYTETFDFMGNSLGITDHPLERPLSIPTLYMSWEILPDATYLLVESVSTGWNTADMRIIHYDETGTILAECPLPYGALPALAVSETVYAVSLANQIILFDTNLRQIDSMPYNGEMNDLYFDEKGTLYGQDLRNVVVQVDFENKKVTEVQPVDRSLWNTQTTAYSQIYVGGDTLFYDADASGITSGTDGTPVLDWDSSFLLWENTEVVQAIGEDILLVISADNLEMEKQYALLRRREGEEEIRREHITVLVPDRGTKVNAAELAAIQFNRTNEQYYVTLEKISEDYEETIFARMQEGNAPDIVLFDIYLEEEYLNLARQGYFTDLSAYDFMKTLTGSAAGAVTDGDSAFRMPYAIQYHTLVRGDGKNGLTTEELVRRTTAGEVLFSDIYWLPEYFQTCMQSLFTDPGAGTCTFDSSQFREYLTFYSSLAASTDAEAGILEVSNFSGRMSTYTLTEPSLPEKLRTDTIPFLLLPVATMDAFGYLELLYGGNGYSICGFPGVPILVSHLESAAVLETGSSMEGAAAFLEYLVSDTVQTSSIITNSYIPVTAAGIEKELAYNWRYCRITSDDVLVTEYRTMEPKILNIFEQRELREIAVTENARQQSRTLLEDDRAGKYADPTITEILQEEISAYLSGDRTMEDTVRVLQSRVGTYLAE
ncbi:MAG: hypothetical protein IJX14_12010, partial [Clostridia bacterium]|nr:hypothetical protein [Clostridia bacterium]